jgi:UDP-N-acetylmuramyl pentapeptide synthase
MILVEPSPIDGPAEAQQTADWLSAHGQPARVSADFRDDHEIWPDVWTSPLDPRLENRRVSCLADYLLKTREVLAVTGTAGKTTTAWLLAQLLPQCHSSKGRAQNLWPGPELLETRGPIVAELTSSHLAFCQHSPRVAAITNFWPDHIEIHGSLEAYGAAKSRLFRFQKPEDVAVLPWDDREAQQLASDSPARRAWFSTGPEHGVFPKDGGIQVGDRHLTLQPTPQLLCALAMAEASGLPWQLPERFQLPPHRAAPRGRLIDDSLAATPRKAGHQLQPGTRLVAGGLLEIAGQPVHASPAEQRALQDWLEKIRQTCTRVDLFGPAGHWLHQQLPGSHLHQSVLEAAGAALQAGPGVVLVSPGFPMLQGDREELSGPALTESDSSLTEPS